MGIYLYSKTGSGGAGGGQQCSKRVLYFSKLLAGTDGETLLLPLPLFFPIVSSFSFSLTPQGRFGNEAADSEKMR